MEILQYSKIANNRLAGIIMVSSAPMKYSQEALVGYPPYEGSFVSWPDQLTESQAKQFMSAGGFNVEESSNYFIVEDAMKTDGRARATMVASVLAGKGIDETEIVKKLSIPLAIIAGQEDPCLGLDYIAQLNYANLWHKKLQWIPHAKHAIPLDQANEVNRLIETFLSEIAG